MFLFNLDERGRPITGVSSIEFVNHWKRLYDEDMYPTDVYERNLNISGLLKPHSVTTLLEWKLAFLQRTEREDLVTQLTVRVWRELESFNRFRLLQEVSEEQFNGFWNLCQGLAKDVQRGFVIGAFLVHIARPLDCPIVDQHVLRAYHFIEHGEVVDPVQNLETYVKYRTFFHQFREQSQNNSRDVDKALMAFGKTLQKFPMLFFQTG